MDSRAEIAAADSIGLVRATRPSCTMHSSSATGQMASMTSSVGSKRSRRVRSGRPAMFPARPNAQAAAAATGGRKTVPMATMQLLAKQGIGSVDGLEAGSLDAALTGLSLEQRVAVKAQLIRAGALA